ncbi:hypothetical protein ACFYO1_21780 [Nocardia sp. NPDC006044]|uniref:hypothetical protein n=1 Tax=Nocardia sp. NPDC006044 TaxID=3364306 RepID=UPI003681B702
MKIGAAVLAVSISAGAVRSTAVRGRIRRARNGVRAVNATRVRRRRLLRSRGTASRRQVGQRPLDLPLAA